MVSGSQIRAARGLLGISAAELAKRAGIGWATLQRIERSDAVTSARLKTLESVIQALEADGIEFLGDPINSPGVILKR